MATTDPPSSLPKSPAIGCAKAWSNLTKKDKEAASFSHTDWISEFRVFLKALRTEASCSDTRGRKTNCTCMKGLEWDDINDCAFYLEEFSCKKRDDRQRIVLEWMRYAKVMRSQQLYSSNVARVYLLPSSSEILICSNACARLIGFAHSAWQTVKKAFDSGDIPYHKSNGNTNAKVSSFDDLLHDFFIKLEGLAAPRATRLVRDIVGDRVEINLRDNDEAGEIELPTYYTKRSLYKKLAADCQWEFSCSSHGKYSEKKSLIDNNTVQKLPDWATFHAFWQKHYSHIRIPRPSEDICEDCHKFVNAYKSSKAKSDSRKRKLEALEQEEVDDSEGDDQEESNAAGTESGSASIPSLDEDDSTGEL